MDIVEEYRRQKEQENLQMKRRVAEEETITSLHKEQIFAVLESAGIDLQDVWTNGYAYNFVHKGMYVSFVNQQTRLCGYAHRASRNSEEAEILKDAYMIGYGHGVSESFATRFREEFRFENFIINKAPAEALKDILWLVDQKKAETFSA